MPYAISKAPHFVISLKSYLQRFFATGSNILTLSQHNKTQN